MVDLPLPVGPVTSSRPCGRTAIRSTRVKRSLSKPSEARSNLPATVGSSRRRAKDSPYSVGRVATLTSMSRPSALIWMRPSCGNRRSAMSSLAISLRRETTAASKLRGGALRSSNTPSMRTRTRNTPSNGSRWMSLADSSSASAIRALTYRITGASDAMSRSWSMSAWAERATPLGAVWP